MIPRDFIDTLLARIDIVDVIDRRVPLKKAGQNYQACCPFHNEKSPSFTVSPSKQFYHCFGCGAHGTAIGFLMEYESLAFPDAVAALAQDAGLTVPNDGGEPARPKPPPALWDALEVAARFYKTQLKQSPRAIEYLKKRGLTGAIAARYGIGYAPDGSPLKLAFEDYGAEALATSGLVIDNDDGRRYDRFRDRIMFPIKNGKGQIVGFGGRVLDKGEPKYLNSPETPLFHKGSELYGLWEARAAIKQAGRVIVAEGYMDVVALAQNGVEFAVAALGTATSPTHARILLRHADRLIFAFDGDNAGRKAAWRALENTLEALQDGKEVRFVFFPEGDDPDSYIRAHGKDAFLTLLDTESLPLSAFLIKTLTHGKRLDTTEGRAALLKDAAPLLDRIAAPLLAGLIRNELAEVAEIPLDELGRLGLKATPARRARPPVARRRPPSVLRVLAQAALMRPARLSEIDLAWLDADDTGARALCGLLEWLPGQPESLAALAEAARDGPYYALIAGLTTDLMLLETELDWDAEFDGALRQLRDDWRRRRQTLLAARPLASLSPEERQELASLARS